MPWEVKSLMSQREEFVSLALQKTTKFARLCRGFKISRKTGYKWLKRHRENGKEGLSDLSRRPLYSPVKTPTEMVQKIKTVRVKYRWGARKIKEVLKSEDPPSITTINNILSREGMIKPEDSSKSRKYIRFEKERPNQLWQMDFKGDFQTGAVRCHPLTILDDYSRYNICLKACYDQKRMTVQQALTGIFRQYGMPEQMNMDNGSPWGNCTMNPDFKYTMLSIWLMRLGIKVSYSRIKHPQTNGKDERFHRSLKFEAIEGFHYKDIHDCQEHFDEWRDIYNLYRPHESLGMKVPASRYQVSTKEYPERLPEIEYSPDMEIRKVDSTNGRISYNGRDFRISRALKGLPVGLKKTETEGKIEVYFCRTRVRILNLLADKT